MAFEELAVATVSGELTAVVRPHCTVKGDLLKFVTATEGSVIEPFGETNAICGSDVDATLGALGVASNVIEFAAEFCT